MQSESTETSKTYQPRLVAIVCSLMCALTVCFTVALFRCFVVVYDSAPVVDNVKENALSLLSFASTAGEMALDVDQSSEFALQFPTAKIQMEAALKNVEETNEYAGVIAKLCDSEIDSTIAQYQEALRIAAEQKRITEIQSEISTRSGMVGRLLVPSVGIDVALIATDGNNDAVTQSIVDAADSCAYVPNAYIAGATILADHSNQDFGALKSVTVGTKGKIVTAAGVTELVATSVMNGHNYGYMTDGSGAPVGAIAPYIAYTCLDSAQNIRIVGWAISG